MTNKTDLFSKLAKLLERQPEDDVIPLLITACARALIQDADGDLDKLTRQLVRFNIILTGQVRDMMTEDLDDAARATKQ